MEQRNRNLDRLTKKEKVKALALELMQQHGIRKWTVQFRKGQEWYKRKGSVSISQKMLFLNEEYFLYDSEEEIKQTILHEIAHILVPVKTERRGKNLFVDAHGDAWKAKAKEIGVKDISDISPNTHIVCSSCFLKNSSRKFNYVKFFTGILLPAKQCCFCKKEVEDQTYIWEDPTKMPCQGIHENENQRDSSES